MAIRSRLGYVLVSLRAYAQLGRPIARWAIRALCALLPVGAIRALCALLPVGQYGLCAPYCPVGAIRALGRFAPLLMGVQVSKTIVVCDRAASPHFF